MFIGIIVFPMMAVYVISVIYLTFRKDKVKTFIENKNDAVLQAHMESGLTNPNGQLELSDATTLREDLADIPFPE